MRTLRSSYVGDFFRKAYAALSTGSDRGHSLECIIHDSAMFDLMIKIHQPNPTPSAQFSRSLSMRELDLAILCKTIFCSDMNFLESVSIQLIACLSVYGLQCFIAA